MKKGITNTLAWLGLLLVCAMIFGIMFWKFDGGKNLEYIQGKVGHYSGTSIVTDNQAIYLYSKYLSLYEGRPNIQEDGSVEVKYDFYSSEKLSYLTEIPYNFWDAPLFNFFRDAFEGMSIPWGIVWTVIAVALIVLILARIGAHKTTNLSFWKKVETGLWLTAHPNLLFKPTDKVPLKHPLNMINKLNINSSQPGIFALRTWRYLPKTGYLYSASASGYTWTEKVVFSDKKPDDKNENGIYGYRLGIVDLHSIEIFSSKILGIVNMSGEYREHLDGVIRAERCEILCLIVNKNMAEQGKQLSQTFGVPVLLSERPMSSYKQWVLSRDGIDCLIHNADILKEEIKWEVQRESSVRAKSLTRSQSRNQS